MTDSDWSDNDGALCDDLFFCNGADACLGGDCSDHEGDVCPENAFFCDGTEECDDILNECYSAGDPCTLPDICDENANECATPTTTTTTPATTTTTTAPPTTTTTAPPTTTTTAPPTTTTTTPATTTTTAPPTTTTTTTVITTTTTTVTYTAPVLSNGAWVPNEIDWSSDCADTPCTALQWFVCDLDNDLLGGDVYFEDTPENLIADLSMPWADLIGTGNDVSDCATPFGPVNLGVLIPEALFITDSDNIWAVNIYASDAQSLTGNVLSSLSLLVHYNPADDDTADDDTADDDADDDTTDDDADDDTDDIDDDLDDDLDDDADDDVYVPNDDDDMADRPADSGDDDSSSSCCGS